MAKEKLKQDAKDTDAAPEEAGEEAPKRKKRGLFKVLIILVVLGAAGGVAWYFMQPGGEKKHAAEQAKHDDKPPVYERLEQFTLNLAGGEHYLQLEIQLKVADEKVAERIKQFMPEIRDRVVALLRKKTVEDVTPPNDAKLPDEIRAEVNMVIKAESLEQGVTMVLFPSFVVQ